MFTDGTALTFASTLRDSVRVPLLNGYSGTAPVFASSLRDSVSVPLKGNSWKSWIVFICPETLDGFN